ncbi:MAG: integrase [Methylocystis sp.]
MIIPLAKRSIDALEPGEKPYDVWFGNRALPGFRLHVRPTGCKTFYLDYRPKEAGERASRSTPKKPWRVGVYGPMPLAEAIRVASQALENIKQGRDPAVERSEQRKAPTVSDLIDAFISDHVDTKCKPSTAEAHKVALQRLRQTCGGVKAKAIGDRLAKMHASGRESPYAANRALAVYAKLYAWGRDRGLVPRDCDPTHGIKRYREEGRERFLTSDDLARLGAALAEAETVGLPYTVDETKAGAKHAPKTDKRRVRLDPFAVAAIRLLILTGARLREILHAQWPQVDFERGILFLPDSKTGRKPVYLSTAARAVLAGLPRVEGNPHIIAGAKDGAPRTDLKKPWAAVCRAAGLEGLRIHDLRHSFASFGASASLGLPIIGKLLGHKQAATTQRYAHLDADPLRRANEAIGATISAAMGGRDSEIIALEKCKRRSS